MPWYSFEWFILKKTFQVESYTAPFIAETARSAGAMYAAYGTGWPVLVVTSPTSEPRPIPMASR